LREDVDAVTVVLDHPLDAADLPLHPMEPVADPLLVVAVLHHAPIIPLRGTRAGEKPHGSYHCLGMRSFPARRRRVALLGASALVACLLPAAASAHAYLVGSDPPAGARLASSPARVVLRFNEDFV